jgi:type IV secretory pathway VirB10-like protein
MTETNDVHESKIAPDDPRLSMSGDNKVTGKRINKKFVVGISAIFMGIILIGLIIALQPVKQKRISDGDEALVKQLEYTTPPDIISGAPDFLKPEASTVPALGPELPGDIGAAMVQPQPQPGVVTQPPQGPSPEEQRRLERERNALWGGAHFKGIKVSQESDQRTSQLPPKGRKNINDTTAAQASMFDKMSGMLDQSGGTMSDSTAKQSMQGEKREFIDNQTTDKGYLESRVTWPKSKFEVKAGSVIPISIITGINSDLPGEIIGQVRENVYDTVTGNYLLIPQGTKVMATYDSVIAYGQERALLCWSQMRRPDGSSLDLECSPGIDLAGYAGMSDQVDNHWGRIIGGVILSTALSVGTTASQGDIEGYNATIEQQMAADAADTINDVGQQITKKNLNIQPTIKIRPGFSANILVNKDMILTPYKL